MGESQLQHPSWSSDMFVVGHFSKCELVGAFVRFSIVRAVVGLSVLVAMVGASGYTNLAQAAPPKNTSQTTSIEGSTITIAESTAVDPAAKSIRRSVASEALKTISTKERESGAGSVLVVHEASSEALAVDHLEEPHVLIQPKVSVESAPGTNAPSKAQEKALETRTPAAALAAPLPAKIVQPIPPVKAPDTIESRAVLAAPADGAAEDLAKKEPLAPVKAETAKAAAPKSTKKLASPFDSQEVSTFKAKTKKPAEALKPVDANDHDVVEVPVVQHSTPTPTVKTELSPPKIEIAPATPVVAPTKVDLVASAPSHPETHVSAPASTASSPSQIPAEKALKWLENGNKRFVTKNLRTDGRSQADRSRLSKSQKPHAIVLSCSDSRVPPEMVFDQALGEIFVIRTAGESLDASVLASIEYAVEHLGPKLLVVMGHTSCGAVHAALTTDPQKSAGSASLDQILAEIRPRIPDYERTPASAHSHGLEVESSANAKGVAADLLKRSEIIRNRVQKGDLVIKPALYYLDSGSVKFY